MARFAILFDETGVRADMAELRRRDRAAFAYVIALLSEWRGAMSISEDFLLPGSQDGLIQDVAWVESLASAGINATRVRLWEVRAWRLIFFVDHREHRAALAAVMHRDQNYEQDIRLWERLRMAYAALGF